MTEELRGTDAAEIELFVAKTVDERIETLRKSIRSIAMWVVGIAITVLGVPLGVLYVRGENVASGFHQHESNTSIHRTAEEARISDREEQAWRESVKTSLDRIQIDVNTLRTELHQKRINP